MEFKRLADVAAVEEATDEANVLIEEGGEIKRVPKTAVGGASAGPVFTCIKASTYVAATPEPTYVYDCSMTFEEIMAQYNEGTLMPATFVAYSDFVDEPGCYYPLPIYVKAANSAGNYISVGEAQDCYCLMFAFYDYDYRVYDMDNVVSLFYLSDGTITTENPTFPDGK